VVADTSLVLGSAPKHLAVQDEVQARDSTSPPAFAAIFGPAKSADLALPNAALAEAPASRPRVPGGGSEEMLTGWRRYQAWSETV
jgi:hypothetical protein